MIKYVSVLLFLFLTLLGCYSTLAAQEDNRAQQIIDKAIAAHGGAAYEDVNVSFTFRKKDYTIKVKGGEYEYSRSFLDSTGQILDVLNNDGLTRTIDGSAVVLSSKDKKKFSNALNSVCYFTLIPNGLNDPAVKKSMIGLNKINGNKYHVVHISFNEEGGGDDHEDEFVYWINQKTYTVDYFAYSYMVNGGGVRFREAKDPVEVGGLRFQNYVNYKYKDKDAPLDSMPFYFVQNKLQKLSEINNENIKVISPGS